VIAGSSAGASIQGDFLVRGAVEGSTLIVAPEPEHHKGFAFLRKSAIDQHINTRNRWDDIIPLIKDRPDLLGIGLSENTAIIVRGDQFEVIGAWKVAVHDNTFTSHGRSRTVLSAGDVYNTKTRRIQLDRGTRLRTAGRRSHHLQFNAGPTRLHGNRRQWHGGAMRRLIASAALLLAPVVARAAARHHVLRGCVRRNRTRSGRPSAAPRQWTRIVGQASDVVTDTADIARGGCIVSRHPYAPGGSFR
jgi:hypothetical protein